MNLFLLQGDGLARYFQKMRLLVRLGFMCALILNSEKAFSNDSSLWQSWNDSKVLYESKNFEKSLQSIQEHHQTDDPEDPHYYYNLGTLYFHLGRLGLSIGNLEKAYRLNPKDPEILSNLTNARSALERKIGTDKLDPASTWIEQLAESLSTRDFRTILGLLSLGVAMNWLRIYIKFRSLSKVLFNLGGFLGILGVFLAIFIYSVQQWANQSPPAISLEKQLVRSGPGTHFIEMSQIEEGTQVRILGPTSKDSSNPSSPEVWRQIRYSIQGIGWVKASSLLTL